MATSEFSEFTGILSAALPQHHLSGFEIAQLKFLQWRNPSILLWNSKVVQLQGETVWRHLRKPQVKPLYYLEFPLLGIDLEKMKTLTQKVYASQCS